jgi:formylglycine-generating enzyme required for sulfatase activity/serine/threonine protein kinase
VKSFVKNAGNFASGLLGVPIAGDILVNTWEYWAKDSADEQQRKAEVEVLARQSIKDVLPEALEALRLEAPQLPEAQRQPLVDYLCLVPATIQRSLRRPEDRSGRSVPPSLALRSANDLLPFLPPTLPRFRQGDALPGRAGWMLDRQLGVGGFGEVWLARKTGYGSLVGAVKFCHNLQTRDRDMLHESKVIDRLLVHGTHANIVRLLDVHLDGDAPWLMYEYVDGGDLADLIHQWSGLPMPQRQQKAIAALHELASAIGYFHRLEPAIVHRDLKPANILLDSRGRLRITDFGIGGIAARQLIESETRGATTRAGRLQSCLYGSYTPLYASSQQRDGAAPDPRDDVHALGVIGYQMLTGHLGQGVGPDFVEDLQESGVAEALITLLRRCTAQKLERRPQDGGEVAEALDKLITKQPAVAALPISAQSADWSNEEIEDLEEAPGDQGTAEAQSNQDLAAQLEASVQAVAKAHDTARELAERKHDYRLAVKTLESVPEHLRDRVLYEKLCDTRDQVALLDRVVREAVRSGRAVGLQFMVASLLEFQPGRQDLRRMLDRLPPVPRPGEKLTISLGQIKAGGFLGFGSRMVDVVMTFAWIPAGVFMMGSPPEEKDRRDDETRHRVTLTKGFFMGIYPVTQAQWKAMMGNNPSRFKGDDQPVEQVSWNDCQEFCKKLRQRDEKPYRLPTEAEWEYACRAGTLTPYSSGDDLNAVEKVACCSGGTRRYQRTQSVGSLAPNAWCLFDMHGNISEWCADWYGKYQDGEAVDPCGDANGDSRVWRDGSWANGETRVQRGGSWTHHLAYCRSAARERGEPIWSNAGCRVCFTPN